MLRQPPKTASERVGWNDAARRGRIQSFQNGPYWAGNDFFEDFACLTIHDMASGAKRCSWSVNGTILNLPLAGRTHAATPFGRAASHRKLFLTLP
eukprot:CAMPEP_0181403142 /NCGR_PEP_ID=MMETSP1110-20121109/3548_1 /TAXON_ID=174948 /ORGANISM="Symbiodinium sp., Strain CCMP421" /LENGTH=94 /DNA_ID=CAMNT_0023525403 /DNA_START=869 /DNA_END=1149 /DNA_ORIENTATION=-